MAGIHYTPEQYLSERVLYQFNWHNQRSTHYKKRYLLLRTLNIILSAFIPILTLVMNYSEAVFKIVIAVSGSWIAINEGILRLNKYHDNWLHYRSIAEALKREEMQFRIGRGDYKGEDAFDVLVTRVENILATGTDRYTSSMGADDKS